MMVDTRTLAHFAFAAACLVFGLPAAEAQEKFLITTYGSTIEAASCSAATAAADCYVGSPLRIDVVEGKRVLRWKGAVYEKDSREEDKFLELVHRLQLPRVVYHDTSWGICRAVCEYSVDQRMLDTDVSPPSPSVSFTYVHKERLDWISVDEVDLVFETLLWPEWFQEPETALYREIAAIARHRSFSLRGRIFRTAMTLTPDVCLSMVVEYRMTVPVADLEQVVGKDGLARLPKTLMNQTNAAREFTCLGPRLTGGATDYSLLLVSSRPISCTLASIDLDELSRAAGTNARELLDQLSHGTAWGSEPLRDLKRAIASHLEKTGMPACTIFIGRIRS